MTEKKHATSAAIAAALARTQEGRVFTCFDVARAAEKIARHGQAARRAIAQNIDPEMHLKLLEEAAAPYAGYLKREPAKRGRRSGTAALAFSSGLVLPFHRPALVIVP